MTERNRCIALLPVEWELLAQILLGRVRVLDLPRDMAIFGCQPITAFHMVEFAVQSEAFAPLDPGMMGTLIAPDGSETKVFPAKANRGFTLGELYRIIGCSTVQMIEIGEEGSMDVDGRRRQIQTGTRA